MKPENAGARFAPLSTSASFLSSALLAVCLGSAAAACGSDSSESDDSSSDSGSTMTSSNMTSAASNGTTGTTGGTSNTSSTDSTSSDTSSSTTGGGGGELPDDMCMGIGNGDACTTPGTCSGRVCGLADTGTRNCTCTDTWSCTSCAWNDPIPEVAQQPEGELPACDAGIADEVPCDTIGDRCMSGTEVCACWLQKDDVDVWDCDSAPSFWE